MIVMAGPTTAGELHVIVGLSYADLDSLRQGIGIPKNGGPPWPFSGLLVMAAKTNASALSRGTRASSSAMPNATTTGTRAPPAEVEKSMRKTLYAWKREPRGSAKCIIEMSEKKPPSVTSVGELWLNAVTFLCVFGFDPESGVIYETKTFATKEKA